MSTNQRLSVALTIAACVCFSWGPGTARGDSCCMPDGCCQDMTTSDCTLAGGTPLGAGTFCGDGFSDNFCINQFPPAGPFNDGCNPIVPAIGFAAATTGCNIGAFSETNLPSLCPVGTPPYDGTPAVWYQITGTGNQITISTCNPGTDFDTVIHVFCNDCNDLICTGGNDDASGIEVCSTFTWCSIFGERYYVLLSNSGADIPGAFEITAVDGAVCANPLPCSPPIGACCPPFGAVCVPDITQLECEQVMGGTYLGNGSTCAGVSCTEGACCDLLDQGNCQVLEQTICESQVPIGRFIFFGNGTTCSPNPCPAPPTGACCFLDAGGCPTCVVTTELDCMNRPGPGIFQGPDIQCTTSICLGSFPVVCGACCDDGLGGTGVCTQTLQQNCDTVAGFVFFPSTPCSPSPCALAAGRCCFLDGTCQEMSQAACTADPNASFFEPGGNCLTLCPQPPPTNDTCATAITLVPPATALADNTAATDGPQGTCGVSAPNQDVWYRVVGTGNEMTVTTCNPGTDYDTMIQVWCGDCLSLTCVDGNDDMGVSACALSGLRSQVVFCTQPGGVYFISVGGWSASEGLSELSLTEGAPCTPTVLCLPPEGACCIEDPVNPGNFSCTDNVNEPDCTTLNGTYMGAFTTCADGGPGIDRCDCNGNGIVDTIDIANGAPDCNGNVILDECETPNPSTVGACCDPVSAGCQLLDDVGCAATGGLFLGFCTICGPNTCSEGADDCNLAPPITDGLINFSTIGATTDGPAHLGCQFDGQTYHDIWWRYTATCNGDLTITTCEELGGSADYDTDIVVYDGCSCASPVLLGCNDDDPNNPCGGFPDYHSTVVVPVQSGLCYLIRVGGFQDGDTGTGTLSINCTPVDPLGSCCVGAGCIVDTEANCLAQGGQYGGDFTDCSPLGACCLPGGSCVLTTDSCCTFGGGSFLGVATDCGESRYNLATCSNPFLDISASGIPLVLADDAGLVVPIGFTFNFFEVPHTNVAVCSNGYLTFGTDLTDLSEDPIPDPLDPNDLIAVLWDDLNPAAGGTVHHQTIGTPGDRHFIAQWTGVPEFGVGAGANTFQVVLNEIDNSVEFHYLAITIAGGPSDWTAGVENFDGSDGLDVSTSVAAGACLTITPDLPMNPCVGDGACCVGQACSAPVTPGACALLGGVFLGLGTDCTGIPCSEGACCDLQGNCTITTEPNCTGEFQGLLTTCDPNPCVGACCDPSNGLCFVVTELICGALPGAYMGDGTTCDPDPCPLPEDCASSRPIGAVPFATNLDISSAGPDGPGGSCDFTAVMQNDVWYMWTAPQDGSGIATVTPANFDAVLVVWEGVDCLSLVEVDCQECDDNLPGCPDLTAPEVSIFPVTTGQTYWFQFGDEGTGAGGGPVGFELDLSTGTGACCVPNVLCQVVGLGTCVLQLGGAYEGDGTSCTPTTPCPGACCLPDATCTELPEADCIAAGGEFFGELAACPVTPCALGACCLPAGCQATTAFACGSLGGQYQGDGVSCDPGFVTSQCIDPFEDISATGTVLTLPDNGGSLAAIGFTFSFYGVAHTDLTVASNGYLTFGGVGGAFINSPIPDAADPNDMIAGLWDDLVPQMGGTIQHETRGVAPDRRFIAQWTNIPARIGFGTSGPNTFQIILFEGTNEIDIRYGDVDVASPNATAGVESQDGLNGVDTSNDIADFACVRFAIDPSGGPCASGACATCPGDTSGNGTLNGVDVATFVDCMIAAQGGAPTAGCSCADMNVVPDGVLNSVDVTLFVNALLNPPACP